VRAVVFGAGSLGSLIGALLAREHDVTLVGRDPHVRAIREDGLTVVDEYDVRVEPDATTDGTGLEADLAAVTVKSFDTDEAARELATGSFDAVVSLQNGMGNERRLATAVDAPVFAGTATYGALRTGPGRVRCTGRGRIVLGPPDGGESPLADRIAGAFASAGIACTAADDMDRRLWEKCAINAAINPVTALAGVENGAILDKPARPVAERAAAETARVARTCGTDLGEAAAIDAVERVARATKSNTSSMARDVELGRRTEIDAINGYVVERATEPVPANATLAGLVKTWELNRGLR
jgi:2-dehydropantoate 2-reductase